MALIRTNRLLLALGIAVVALLVANSVLVAAVAIRGQGLSVRVAAGQDSPTEFSFAPDRIFVPAGTAVALEFVNASSAPHTLVLLAPIDRRTSHSVMPGASERIDFTTPEAGRYRFVCSVHEGMRGSLIVE